MFICENEFDRPDHKTPDYSLDEVDYYAWIPYPHHSEMPNHRLSLRKNLVTGEFEVYRRFNQTYQRSSKVALIITQIDGETEEVAYKGDLKGAIYFACAEWRRYHGEGKEDDEICEHQHPKKALFCRVK